MLFIQNAEYTPITSSVVIIRNVERKILLIPIIFMLLSIAAFVTDICFIFQGNKSFRYLKKTEPGITFVHFLTVCNLSMKLYAYMYVANMYGVRVDQRVFSWYS